MNKIQGCALLITVVIILLVNIIYGLKPGKKRFKEGDTKVVNIDDKGIIPKNIFKTGIDDYNKINKDLFSLFSKTIDENPDFEIEYYSDKGSREFVKNNFSKRVLDTYDKLIPGAYKADLFRYCILYKRGGIYSDLSQNFLLPL